jgi:hypothetical protein
VQPLSPPDSFHFDAATGWLLLENPQEALLELNQIAPQHQNHPNVLELRWTLQATLADWSACLATGQALVEIAPDRVSGWIHRAYACRRASNGGLTAAWDALLPAADRFPDETIIPYNLACYACQKGDIAAARSWLERAWRVAENAGEKSKWIGQALADADLESLWPEIRQMESGRSE